jgi:hypothetical protein
LHSRTCNICQKILSRNRSMNLHIQRVHDRIKSLRCQFCEKCFSQKTHLKIHTEKRHKQSSDIHSL